MFKGVGAVFSYRIFLVAVRIVRDILSDEYFNHYCLLVISHHILLSVAIQQKTCYS